MDIILNNLVSNAVKYNREGGKVTVGVTRRRRGRRGASVADTGIGLEPEQTAKLFEEFVRIKNENAGIPGSGLDSRL